jgi:hypothetical protein
VKNLKKAQLHFRRIFYFFSIEIVSLFSVFPEKFRCIIICATICESNEIKVSEVLGSYVFHIVNFLWESGDRIERDQMNACCRHSWIGGS